jgi:hypothetical protein
VGTQFFFHELHLTGFIPNSWCIECLELKFCSHPIVTYPYLRIQAFMVLFFALQYRDTTHLVLYVHRLLVL